jgi:hypothetical protein
LSPIKQQQRCLTGHKSRLAGGRCPQRAAGAPFNTPSTTYVLVEGSEGHKHKAWTFGSRYDSMMLMQQVVGLATRRAC